MHESHSYASAIPVRVRLQDAVDSVALPIAFERRSLLDGTVLAPLLAEPAELILPFDGVTMLAAASGLSTLRAIASDDRQVA